MIDGLKGWTETNVNLVCVKLRGVSYDKTEVSREQKDGYIPILRANNINNDRLIFEDLVFVPIARVSAKQKLQPNDVVVAMSSGSKSVVGKTAQLLEAWEGSFGAFCGVLRPASYIDGRYFGFFFRTKEYRARVSDLSATLIQQRSYLLPAHKALSYRMPVFEIPFLYILQE